MAGKKIRAVIKRGPASERKQRGRVDRGAMFPVTIVNIHEAKTHLSRSLRTSRRTAKSRRRAALRAKAGGWPRTSTNRSTNCSRH
jgi:hypothetical protein